MSPDCQVVLVRHGETEWSRTGRHTGRTDVPLASPGRAQGAQLARELAGASFWLVLTSPLRRAADTCRLAGLGEQAEQVDDLMEWDYGEYEGKTTAEIRSEHPEWSLWRDGAPGGEGSSDVAARVDRVISRVRRKGGRVALFAHGHVLRVLAARWLGLPASNGSQFKLDTATLSVLSYEREVPVIEIWNVPVGRGSVLGVLGG